MWLLSTSRAELQFFPTPESVPRGYAILSHVWDKEEQTFQDIQALRAQCATSEGVTSPRDLASAKIKNFCILAERHGYQWAWVDTCCIDKTSSSELSEAINSMYRYYSLAQVCYAYLRDVPSDCAMDDRASEFGTSIWHRRGWTLQELIAPEVVVFLSKYWEVLGTKADLAPVLESITSVPASVLTLESELTEISIAARMSWAADRRTTRPEDEAYCLMGIFAINMPTLYGEGKEAFRRLQEEIMKRSVDTSIVAWGYCRPGYSTSLIAPQYIIHDHADEMYLLAPSPSAFQGCSARHFTPPRKDTMSGGDVVDEFQQQPVTDSVGIPTFTITPYGILAHIPVVEAFDLTIAVLFCTEERRQLGLLLARCPDAPDPARPLYHTCFRFSSGVPAKFGRLIELGEHSGKLYLKGTPVATHWKSIYLAHRPPPIPPTRILVNRSLSTPFRLPIWHINELQQHSNVELLTPAHQVLQFPWKGTPPAMLRFRPAYPRPAGSAMLDFGVYLGRCSVKLFEISKSSHRARSLGPHWANVRPVSGDRDRDSDSASSEHDCSVHHIADWPRRTKTFSTWGGSLGAVQLSFAPCPLNPSGTLVVSIKPLGWPVAAPKKL